MAGPKVLCGWKGKGKQSLITSGTHEFFLESLSRSVPPSASHRATEIPDGSHHMPELILLSRIDWSLTE